MTIGQRLQAPLRKLHARLPPKSLGKIPFNAFAIVFFLILVNLIVWAVCLGVLSRHTEMYATAVLAWSLGLRHALDADHISAIDLMTRRLIASGQRPVTVGTFFSLGHSTIVIITTIATAATASKLSDKFGQFSGVGNIIGTSISATFLILLGFINAWILYKLIHGLREWILSKEEIKMGEDLLEKRSGGPMFWIIKRLFKVIDRPWKMYPLGCLFGLGFDTSSEVALLGLASIQASKGTSIWFICCYPALFTAGMALIDTLDSSLMLTIYTWCDDAQEEEGKLLTELQERFEETPQLSLDNRHMQDTLVQEEDVIKVKSTLGEHPPDMTTQDDTIPQLPLHQKGNSALHNPLIFLYYSTILTALTVLIAIFIGSIQLFSLLRNVIKPEPEGPFWDGVTALSDNYDIVGGCLAGSFLVCAVVGLLCWPRFKRWIHRKREVVAQSRVV